MLLLTCVSFATGEIPITSLLLGMVLTIAAVCVYVFGVVRWHTTALAGLAALISSKAFVDYSTSGLENSLTHLLLVVFVWVYFSKVWNPRTFFYLTMVAALAALNRMDTILFYLPALMWVGLALPKKQLLIRFAIGMLPFLLWLLFSIVYYGYPFPNTAYAKLGVDISRWLLIEQGILYVLYSINMDPITPLMIVLGFVAPFVFRENNKYPLVIGMALYLSYVIWIGGDFMGGRYFSASFFLAVILLIQNRPLQFGWMWAALVAMIIGIGLMSPLPNLLSDSNYGESPLHQTQLYGIIDEREFYYPYNGLLKYERGRGIARYHMEYSSNLKMKKAEITLDTRVGMLGYFVGSDVHVIDVLGICDPMLAHFPKKSNSNWRIGHFFRKVPEGYQETILSNNLAFRNPYIAEYYEKVQWLTQKPIFSWKRFAVILKMNLGYYDELLKNGYNTLGPEKRMAIEDLQTRVKEGSLWSGPNTVQFDEDGIQINIGKTINTDRFELAYDNNDIYRMVFLNGSNVVGEVQVRNEVKHLTGMFIQTIEVPQSAAQAGYGAIRLYPVKGDGNYSIGHLILK